jgi:hypothetical protein
VVRSKSKLQDGIATVSNAYCSRHLMSIHLDDCGAIGIGWEGRGEDRRTLR